VPSCARETQPGNKLIQLDCSARCAIDISHL
jgi:hypothetical protein